MLVASRWSHHPGNDNLEQHTAAGAILVASAPPTSAFRTTLRTLRRHPMPFIRSNVTLSLAPLVATPELVRDLCFSASMPDEQVKAYQQRLQDESGLAVLDLIAFDLVKTKRVNRVPMLVLGAENDTQSSQQQVRRTAAAYGTQAEFFPDMAHNMMLERGWQAVAERMASWLIGTLPTSTSTPTTPPG